jgi:methylenetetrahydrofolate reductase (NADPH)
MKTKVSGMSVPDELVHRMKAAADPKKEGLSICVETIERLKDIEGVHGVHIMSIGWEEVVPEIVERSGVGPNNRS